MAGITSGRSRPCSRWSAVLLLLACGGCYAYRPVPLDSIEPGQEARVTLDPEAFGRVVNGAANSGFPVQSMNMSNNAIEGTVSSRDGGGVTVEMSGGNAVYSARVPAGAVQEAGLRELSRWRTGAAVGAGLVLAAFMIESSLIADVGGGTNDPPANVTAQPLLRIRVPW